jgi:hypothetical protein
MALAARYCLGKTLLACSSSSSSGGSSSSSSSSRLRRAASGIALRMMAVILRRGHAERMMKVAAVSREMRDVAKARGAGAVLRRRATLVV